VVESAAFNVKLSQNAPSSSAVPLPQKERQSAASMEAHQLDLELSKADNVAPRLKPSTAMKRAKRDLIGLLLCVGLGRWRTLVTRWGSCMAQERRGRSHHQNKKTSLYRGLK
jgi:hypothetical protein